MTEIFVCAESFEKRNVAAYGGRLRRVSEDYRPAGAIDAIAVTTGNRSPRGSRHCRRLGFTPIGNLHVNQTCHLNVAGFLVKIEVATNGQSFKHLEHRIGILGKLYQQYCVLGRMIPLIFIKSVQDAGNEWVFESVKLERVSLRCTSEYCTTREHLLVWRCRVLRSSYCFRVCNNTWNWQAFLQFS